MQIFMGGRGNGKTVEQKIVAISEGNPGCMQFCCELLSKGGYEALLMLTEAGLKGSRAYQLWNDCCGRDTEKAIKVLQYRKDGRINLTTFRALHISINAMMSMADGRPGRMQWNIAPKRCSSSGSRH